jgi:epoxyqueuosine reductase
MSADPTLGPRIRELARAQGFARVGFANAEPLAEDGERLRAWLAQGFHGSMDYLARSADVRVDPAHPKMVVGARSVIALAAPYGSKAPHAHEPGRIARYAQSRDYHSILYTRVRALTKLLRDEGYNARASVDTLPVLERAWAARAGLGFIGKNCLLIIPGLGSYVLLAVVVTSAELPPDEPMRERCGQCRLCLDVCPTRAFVKERVLDARRCIAYLTIEHEGEIAEELRPAMGEWLFGCDACQEVCPFNRKAPEAPDAALLPSSRMEEIAAEELLQLDAEYFEATFARSPLRRPGREGLARNAAIVLGNAREKRALPILQRAARHDPAHTVRDAAQWAVERIEEQPRTDPLEQNKLVEKD